MSRLTATIKAAGTAAVVLSALSGAALADDTGSAKEAAAETPREFTWSVIMAATSDYVYRGISSNTEDPAFQPYINFGYGILYAGVWSTNVADPYGPQEADFYVGITPTWGPVTFDFGAVYYTFFGADEDLDYYELRIGLSASPFENFTLAPAVSYTPDQSNYGETWTLEATANYTLPAVGIFTPTIGALIGHTEAPDGPASGFFADGVNDYTYWNAGLALAVENFTFDFRYWDTDIEGSDLADERFVFSASLTLP